MRLLHIGDLNGNTAWLDWLVNVSGDFDLVCITGNIVGIGPLVSEPAGHVENVISRLRDLGAPLALVCGDGDLLQSRELSLVQLRRALNGKEFFPDHSIFWFRDYRFRCVACCEPVPKGKCRDDFWLIHKPPYGARTSTVVGGFSDGCSDLRNAMLVGHGPHFALSGNTQAPIGFWSVLHDSITLNPGHGNHPSIPSHIVIDMVKERITHHKASTSGVEKGSVKFTA